MKALFLDVDGVLNSAEWTRVCAAAGNVDLCDVDPAAVARVLRVLSATGATLVLSSTWRFVPKLVAQLRTAGLPIADSTPRLDAFGPRSDEIKAWLSTHPACTTYAIVDDSLDAGFGLTAHFIPIDQRVGFTDANASATIDMLLSTEDATSEVLRFA